MKTDSDVRTVSAGGRTYEVLDTLGSGLQGKVKKGRCIETDEIVALKFLLKKKLGVADGVSAAPEASVAPGRDLANLHREVNALRKVSTHPHVVAIKDVSWDCDLPRKNTAGVKHTVLIVMELAQGGELLDFLMFTGAFNEQIARAYFMQLISAVHHCHEANIAHRDLKPENLLLDDSFTLKVADFGLSAVSDESILLRTQCGTPGYMAPEIIRLDPYRGQAADVWSCGVLLFIMLTGFPPFYMAKPGDWWFDRIRAKQHHLFWQAHARNAGAFSPGAMALMNKIFQADPKDRVAVKDILEDPWLKPAPGVTAPIAPEVLAADMRRRHTEVVARKAQEREEARKKKEAERMASARAKTSARVDPFARRAVRALPGDGDDPALAVAGSPVAMPPACPTFHNNTWFVAPQSPSGVLDAITDALSRHGAAGVKRSDPSFKVKASVAGPMGTVTFSTRVYRCAESAEGVSISGDDEVVIAVQRLSGDAIQFQEVFATLCRELGAEAPDHIPMMPKAPVEGDALAGSGDSAPAEPLTLSAAGSVSERVTLL